MSKSNNSTGLGIGVAFVLITLMASSLLTQKPVMRQDHPAYANALNGTPQAILDYCGGSVERAPGQLTISGYFADCVAWLEVMREIEAGR